VVVLARFLFKTERESTSMFPFLAEEEFVCVSAVGGGGGRRRVGELNCG
jgi:hypothetical protein